MKLKSIAKVVTTAALVVTLAACGTTTSSKSGGSSSGTTTINMDFFSTASPTVKAEFSKVIPAFARGTHSCS